MTKLVTKLFNLLKLLIGKLSKQYNLTLQNERGDPGVSKFSEIFQGEKRRVANAGV